MSKVNRNNLESQLQHAFAQSQLQNSIAKVKSLLEYIYKFIRSKVTSKKETNSIKEEEFKQQPQLQTSEDYIDPEDTRDSFKKIENKNNENL